MNDDGTMAGSEDLVEFCKKHKLNISSIKELTKIDPFELFDIEKGIKIDNELLEEKLLRLQSKFHPDRFINSSEDEKSFSHNLSSKINESYNILLDNVSRINLMLKNHGYKISEDSKSFEDKSVLIEIMDLQSECLLLDTVEQKNTMIKKINKIINQTIEEIFKNFNLKQYVDVYKLNIKLSYLEKMKKNLKDS
ncbi:MAG: Fe-S protein assembly co-chaperone HscB [Rickettsiales bacterium]|nr:Fe-S protein assembly co-chaperone HscB [Rickettsiales bacterium]|tara:strand:- start:3550 stop:4131 length:582 start_codon:yes stop_codon:yes gene_type:complete